MFGYKYIIKAVVVAVVIVALGVGVWFLFRGRQEKEPEVTVMPGKIRDVKGIVQLCAMDIYLEEPVLDTLNSKVIFGMEKLRGSISYDVEHLRIDTVGDTIRAIMPDAIIELYESTEPKSWEVIDTKSLKLFGSSKFTPEEENAVKKKSLEKVRARLLTDGTEARARKEAAENLRLLLEALYRRPATVR